MQFNNIYQYLKSRFSKTITHQCIFDGLLVKNKKLKEAKEQNVFFTITNTKHPKFYLYQLFDARVHRVALDKRFVQVSRVGFQQIANAVKSVPLHFLVFRSNGFDGRVKFCFELFEGSDGRLLLVDDLFGFPQQRVARNEIDLLEIRFESNP